MFAYLRTLTVPTSLFAAPEDWSDPALATRIDRAARELVLLMESGFARNIKDESWQSYQHEYGSAAEPRPPSTSTPTSCGSRPADPRSVPAWRGTGPPSDKGIGPAAAARPGRAKA